MPRPVLTWVAALLALGALGSFAMGIVNAPERGGRLPGERPADQAAGPATVINATEATPLSQERIEGPPPAPEKPAVNKTEEAAADEADQATNTLPGPPAKGAEPGKPAAATNTTPAPDRVGDILQQASPPPEQPPY